MKRHTEESMLVLYEIWEKSGLSKKAFAVERNVKPSTFYYWVKKIEQSQRASPQKKGFRPIVLEEVVSIPSVTATIRYPSGISVEWHGGSDTVHLLKALL